MILLISGPPGAGKSTVARHIVKSWGAPVSYIEGDVFWTFFATHAPAESPIEARKRDGRIIVQAMIATAARFARGGYDAVVDFSIAPWALSAIRDGLKDRELDYVVLCPSEATCAARVAARSAGRILDYAPYREFHAAFRNLGAFECHAIRDDRADPDELAARIHTGLAAGDYRLAAPP